MSKFTTFSTVEINSDSKIVQDVHPEEVSGKRDQLTIIDVRTEKEYVGKLGHIPGSRLINIDKLTDEIDGLSKDQTLVFVCHSGGRSTKATILAKNRGFESVYNMKGGMVLWNKMGLDTKRSLSQ